MLSELGRHHGCGQCAAALVRQEETLRATLALSRATGVAWR